MLEVFDRLFMATQNLPQSESAIFNEGFVIANLLSGVAGTVIGLLGNAIVVFARNKYAERKYTIRGEYMTEFEDEKDGARIVRKAPIVLKQSGKKIHGITTEDEGHRKRAWELEGEIRSNDRITGWYTEKGFEAGTGTFFLEVKRNKDMEGVWAGYDSVNKKINSGTYLFRHIPQITIRDINSSQDTAVILDMADKQLGRDYIRPDDIGRNMPVAICAEKDQKVVGFCTGKTLQPEEFLKEIKLVDSSLFPGLTCMDKIGILKSIAVDPIYIGRCVGSRLVQECIARLRKKGARMLFTMAWRSSHGANIGSIAMRLGFEPKQEIHNYWRDDSVEKGYSCPECGKPPCRCTAILYVRPYL